MIRAPKFVVRGYGGRAAGGAVGLIAASDYWAGTEGWDQLLGEVRG
jgi:hypothetical protein